MLAKIADIGTKFSVGAIAAAATAPAVESWIGLVISCVTIILSVLLSGVVNGWLSRSMNRKNDAETERFLEMGQSEHLKNTVRLLDLKEEEIDALQEKIDALMLEVKRLQQLVESIKNENDHLRSIIATKLTDEVIDALRGVEKSGD